MNPADLPERTWKLTLSDILRASEIAPAIAATPGLAVGDDRILLARALVFSKDFDAGMEMMMRMIAAISRANVLADAIESNFKGSSDRDQVRFCLKNYRDAAKGVS